MDNAVDERRQLIAALREYHADMVAEEGGECGASALYRDAANEIERATSEVERMREALRDHCIERGTEYGQCHECDGFWLLTDDGEKHTLECAALSPQPPKEEK